MRSPNPPRAACVVALATAFLAAGAMPAAADVTTAIDAGGTLHIVSDTDDDRIVIALNPVNSQRLNVSVAGGPDVRTFERSAFDRIQVEGGRGDDVIEVGAGFTDTEPFTANLGIGSDRFSGSPGPETVLGGEGSDTIGTAGGADTISGESGRDIIDGGTDSDQMSGGLDSDLFFRSAGDGADKISGGQGADEVEFSGTDAVETWTISSADGNTLVVDVPLEPARAEVTGIEEMYFDGLDGNDTAEAEPDVGVSLYLDGGDDDDTLTGGSGDDLLEGDAGNDRLTGRGGENTFDGGGGSDVFSCEGRDTLVDFSPEDSSPNCFGSPPAPEPPAPAPADPAPPVADVPVPPASPGDLGGSTVPAASVAIARTALKANRRGQVAVKLSCPAGAAATCRGRLVLKNGRVTAGSARFAIAAGRTATVRVKLSSRTRSALRRAGKLRLTATAGSAKRTLRVSR